MPAFIPAFILIPRLARAASACPVHFVFLALLVPAALLLSPAAWAASGWLIATTVDTVRGGDSLRIEVVRPDETQPWPETLPLRLQAGTGDGADLPVRVTLQAAERVSDSRRIYRGELPAVPAGVLRIALADRPANPLVLLATATDRTDTGAEAHAGDPLAAMNAPVAAAASAAVPVRIDPLPSHEPALSAHEPVYFLLGARDGLNARFQLSFKYRLFDENGALARAVPALGKLHFGYTQTSLWDLAGESKPFHDTSYRPSFFWQGALGEAGSGLLPGWLRGGYEHESNGKDGASSRSIDTLFLQPVWRTDFADGRTLLFAPKAYAYLDREDNPEIARYRGHVDWQLRYGNERGWVLAARLRRGTAGHGSGQIDLSVPLREPLFSRTGGFLHLQVFSGYGQSLLDYPLKSPPQWRLGFSIVR